MLGTCPACGEAVRTVVSLGRIGSQRFTDHVRSEHDEAKRCRYDGGQGSGDRALESFPGDTIP